MQSPGAAAYRAVLAAQGMGGGCNAARGPPLQTRVVAANGTVRTTSHDDPGAHGMNGGKQSKLERGQMMRAVGMAWQRRAGTQSLLNKAAAGEHSRRTLRQAQASKKQQPAVGRPRSKTTAADEVGRPLAVQCR